MKHIVFTLLLSTLLISQGFGQQESNFWFFGSHAGIEFSSGSPIAVNGNAMDQQEGCATQSDSLGSLLFYTDGITVWDNTNNAMPNGSGLLGGFSSTQSALIVPHPGSTTKYLLFTAAQNLEVEGINYSIIDMTLNTGLGDVETGSKNINVAGVSTEKLSATKHANSTDYWILSHGWNNDQFNAYLLTSSGLNLAPVSTNIGSTHSGTNNFIGCMKIAPSGGKVAVSISRDDKVEVFDFDASTGLLSNLRTLVYDVHTYGVSFSPNSTLLYTNTFDKEIFQYNLTTTNLQSSEVLVGSYSTGGVGALQLASDGKLYLARNNIDSLGVIECPNLSGTSCGFIPQAVALGGNMSKNGLPNFIDDNFASGFELDVDISVACAGNATQFITNIPASETVTWIFNDPTSGTANTSTDANPTHEFTAVGTYQVLLIRTVACGIDTTIFNLEIESCGSCDFFIPNVFTPNNDINNSTFYVNFYGGNATCEVEEMSIYNRWGQLMYQSDTTPAWNGKNESNKAAPTGTYYYQIKIEEEVHTGFLNLFR